MVNRAPGILRAQSSALGLFVGAGMHNFIDWFAPYHIWGA